VDTGAPLAGEEFKFEIEGFLLSSLPISRVIKYLEALKTLIGAPAHTHVQSLADGSLHAGLLVDGSAAVKAHECLGQASREDGGRPRAAFVHLNAMIAEDGGVGTLRSITRDRRLLTFPGRAQRTDPLPSFWEEGALRGRLVGLATRAIEGRYAGDIRNAVETQRFFCSEATALALTKYLFTVPIEVSGRGRWRRQAEAGQWKLLDFEVSSFRALRPASLREIRQQVQEAGGLGLNSPEAMDTLRGIR